MKVVVRSASGAIIITDTGTVIDAAAGIIDFIGLGRATFSVGSQTLNFLASGVSWTKEYLILYYATKVKHNDSKASQYKFML